MAKHNQTTKTETEVQVAQVEEKTYNVEQLLTSMKTKSAVIRYLSAEGLTRSKIANLLNIRYQHVRNVLLQPLKKQAEEKVETVTAE